MARQRTERVTVAQPMLLKYDSHAREDALELARTGGFGYGCRGSFQATADGPAEIWEGVYGDYAALLARHEQALTLLEELQADALTLDQQERVNALLAARIGGEEI